MFRGFVIIFIIPILFYSGILQSQEMLVTGVYQGKNIYVQNPVVTDGKNFCTREVYLNGKKVISEPTASAFEIDLSGLMLNSSLEIKILHDESCSPKIINPQVIRPKDKFRFVDFSIDEKEITWQVEGDKNVIRYFIEKRINDKWIIVQTTGTFQSEDTITYYRVGLVHEGGENLYRIKSILKSGDYIYSGLMNFISEQEPVSFYPERVTDKITLSRETDFEVFDVNGNLMVKGKKKEISLDDLSPGLYYLVIENRTEKFIKK